MTRRLTAVVLVLALVLLAGCGGDTNGEPAVAAKINREPRVDGRWRVVYTPFTGEQGIRATWTVTPACSEGACGFKVKSTATAKYRFVYDSAIKDWTGRYRTINPCGDPATDEVKVKGAYRAVSQITLTPSRAVRGKTGTFVTEMFGERRDESSLTPAGERAGCDPTTVYQQSVRAVRIDPPAGKQQMVGPKVEEGE